MLHWALLTVGIMFAMTLVVVVIEELVENHRYYHTLRCPNVRSRCAKCGEPLYHANQLTTTK